MVNIYVHTTCTHTPSLLSLALLSPPLPINKLQARNTKLGKLYHNYYYERKTEMRRAERQKRETDVDEETDRDVHTVRQLEILLKSITKPFWFQFLPFLLK